MEVGNPAPSGRRRPGVMEMDGFHPEFPPRCHGAFRVIDSAIVHVGAQLNQALRRSMEVNEDVVEVSHLLDQDGTLGPNINNKLVLFLVNIQRDGSVSSHPGRWGVPGAGTLAQGYPTVHLNLFIMVAAHFPGQNYREALKFISGAILFFQGNPVFTHQNSPDLDRRIQRLTMEIENLGLQELSHLWGVLGGKYLPSVLYKMRMISLDSGDLDRLIPRVSDPVASALPGGGR